METELREVADGLWLWRVEHPDRRPGHGWNAAVNATCVESRGEVAVLDPIAPSEAGAAVWERLDARPPTVVAVLKPDHVRDVDAFVDRYGARASGPHLFWRHDIPDTELEPIWPGDPVGLRAGSHAGLVGGLRRGP